jgi:hypothetical protein
MSLHKEENYPAKVLDSKAFSKYYNEENLCARFNAAALRKMREAAHAGNSAKLRDGPRAMGGGISESGN